MERGRHRRERFNTEFGRFWIRWRFRLESGMQGCLTANQGPTRTQNSKVAGAFRSQPSAPPEDQGSEPCRYRTVADRAIATNKAERRRRRTAAEASLLGPRDRLDSPAACQISVSF